MTKVRSFILTWATRLPMPDSWKKIMLVLLTLGVTATLSAICEVTGHGFIPLGPCDSETEFGPPMLFH